MEELAGEHFRNMTGMIRGFPQKTSVSWQHRSSYRQKWEDVPKIGRPI